MARCRRSAEPLVLIRTAAATVGGDDHFPGDLCEKGRLGQHYGTPPPPPGVLPSASRGLPACVDGRRRGQLSRPHRHGWAVEPAAGRARPSTGPVGAGQPRALSASISCGSTLCTSPTIPRSATEKMGASWSLLMATMFFEFFMPTRCWVAPEIPQAT